MSGSTFTIDQITELREIEKRRIKKGGDGLRAEVQEFIIRLTSGDVRDKRARQASNLWDKGWGLRLGFHSFEEYLKTIPEIPECAHSYLRLPVLVDRRITITAACDLVGLKFEGDDQTFVPFDRGIERSDVYWMMCQVGWAHKGKSVLRVRYEFQSGETGCDAFEGVALYASDPKITKRQRTYLPDSVWAKDPRKIASLVRIRDEDRLFLRRDTDNSGRIASRAI